MNEINCIICLKVWKFVYFRNHVLAKFSKSFNEWCLRDSNCCFSICTTGINHWIIYITKETYVWLISKKFLYKKFFRNPIFRNHVFSKHFISKTLSLSVCESFFNCFVFSKYFFENTYFEKLSRTLNQGRLRKDFFENTYFEKLSKNT